jgi:predicted RNA binding protein YcfA (HicA-like mRNA interferase family)
MASPSTALRHNPGVVIVPWSSDDLIRILLREGWVLKRVRGSHHQSENRKRTRMVTVPHPSREIPRGTLAAIRRSTGIDFGRNP